MISISDDEEEDEEAKQAEGEMAATSSGDGIKPDPDGPKSKNDDDPLSLHIYTEAELATFERGELVADTEVLDGKSAVPSPIEALLKAYRYSREVEECETEYERP